MIREHIVPKGEVKLIITASEARELRVTSLHKVATELVKSEWFRVLEEVLREQEQSGADEPDFSRVWIGSLEMVMAIARFSEAAGLSSTADAGASDTIGFVRLTLRRELEAYGLRPAIVSTPEGPNFSVVVRFATD